MHKKILAIGAHFDDIELGCGGSLAKHTKEGDDVYAYVATLSGFSNPGVICPISGCLLHYSGNCGGSTRLIA